VSRKKVLVLIDWYLPGYKAGGPIQSVANIIQHLKEEFEFAVITSNKDLHEKEAYDTVQSDTWTTAPDGTRTYYLSSHNQNLKKLKELIIGERADYIYINSLFSVPFTILPLYIRKRFLPNRKVVLAPRGMLGKGALNIKPGKKKVFLLASRFYGLFNNIIWHASTHLEAEEVKNTFGNRARVIEAVNLTASKNLDFVEKEKKSNECRLVFISRIASKKNILPVIHALNQLPADTNVIFDIYGPVDEAAYWQQCEDAIRKVQGHIQIQYKGPVKNSGVMDIFRSYHFSILYTRHENFGHSIIESMAAGCPVIISDQTPWRNLESRNAGWDVPVDNENALLEVLKRACSMNKKEYDNWSRSALTFAAAVIHDEKALAANRSLFQ
jgi:glycosyltransferase involved in cell wall biosynthesis